MYRRGVKRHPALIPLSLDHHDALVLAQGLILGRSKAPRSDWPTSRPAQIKRVADFFTETLQPHFKAEETWVFPGAARFLQDGPALVRDLISEHEQIRALIHGLEQNPTINLETRLPTLGRLLETHIRTEERVLFESMQRELPIADLETLGAQLARLPARGPSGRAHYDSPGNADARNNRSADCNNF